MSDAKVSKQERYKEESNYLAGNIAEDLASDAPTVTDESYELLKFHGTYEGFNRDTATERKKQGLDKEYEFMLRLKLPGGRLTAEQYLALDAMADSHSNGTLRLTTRETFQFHHVGKGELKTLIAEINHALMSTLGGCGDVVRNIMTNPAPYKNPIQQRMEEDCDKLAIHFTPRTTSYYEIWLDGEKIEEYKYAPLPSDPEDVEPIYGKHYMPRKFKIGLCRPEENSIDILTHDLAVLALFDGDTLTGYNIAIGGGLGMNHNKPDTYPRLASPICFVGPDELIPACEAVVKLQRDHGDRANRKHARLKYVVEERGLDWAKHTLENYVGHALDAPRPMQDFHVPDQTGWHEQGDGSWFLGVPVSSGRIVDRGSERIRTGLREVIRQFGMPLVCTADQNLILADIAPADRDAVTQRLREHGIKLHEDITPLYRSFLACVSYPTCGKALAEAERVKLPLVNEFERIMEKYGLADEDIYISLAGCPNGCSRPYTGEIGLVGRTPGTYAIYVGGLFERTELNEKLFDKVPYEQLPPLYDALIAQYTTQRHHGEGYGAFARRVGTEAVKNHAIAALGSDTTAKWG